MCRILQLQVMESLTLIPCTVSTISERGVTFIFSSYLWDSNRSDLDTAAAGGTNSSTRKECCRQLLSLYCRLYILGSRLPLRRRACGPKCRLRRCYSRLFCRTSLILFYLPIKKYLVGKSQSEGEFCTINNLALHEKYFCTRIARGSIVLRCTRERIAKRLLVLCSTRERIAKCSIVLCSTRGIAIRAQ